MQVELKKIPISTKFEHRITKVSLFAKLIDENIYLFPGAEQRITHEPFVMRFIVRRWFYGGLLFGL